MPTSEFQLIADHFTRLGVKRDDVPLGVGDDCALLQVPPGQQLAVTLDTLVAGVHFFPDMDPEALGHKALAVNLSDLAAMGAEPAWVTLALTLPGVDEAWISAFCRGFSRLAEHHHVQLVGGDTTKGPLAITVQAHGFVEAGQALRRDGARPGDQIYVSGTLGDAALALQLIQGASQGTPDPALLQRLERPQPRVEVGRLLRQLASSAIDISDGLLADLGHICRRSGVGAILELASVPLSKPLQAHLQRTADWSLPLTGGDDYELCLTIPAASAEVLERLLPQLDTPLTRVGEIVAGDSVTCVDEAGKPLKISQGGYDHFSKA